MNSVIGIDIGSHSIKAIEMARDGNTMTLLSAGSMATPKRVSTSSTTDLQAVAYVIKQLLKEAGMRSSSVHVAFPESQVFTRVIEVPQLSERELSAAIQWEAEQYIPIPLDQVNMDFTILRDAKATGSGKMEVLLVAAPKTLIDRYSKIIELADLDLTAAETEIIACSRALVRSVPNLNNVLIASMGAQTTDFAILTKGVISVTRSIGAGGEALSRSIGQALDFNTVQAEEYKKTYGLDKSFLEGKIQTAAKPVMDTLMTEMKRAIAYFEDRHQNEKVEAAILSGGSAKMPGIVAYMAEGLGIETLLGNPWAGIHMDQRFSVLIPEGTLFSVAVGLALRDAN
jgi:type IV pilus assembly protein PilM